MMRWNYELHFFWKILFTCQIHSSIVAFAFCENSKNSFKCIIFWKSFFSYCLYVSFQQCFICLFFRSKSHLPHCVANVKTKSYVVFPSLKRQFTAGEMIFFSSSKRRLGSLRRSHSSARESVIGGVPYIFFSEKKVTFWSSSSVIKKVVNIALMKIR